MDYVAGDMLRWWRTDLETNNNWEGDASIMHGTAFGSDLFWGTQAYSSIWTPEDTFFRWVWGMQLVWRASSPEPGFSSVFVIPFRMSIGYANVNNPPSSGVGAEELMETNGRVVGRSVVPWQGWSVFNQLSLLGTQGDELANYASCQGESVARGTFNVQEPRPLAAMIASSPGQASIPTDPFPDIWANGFLAALIDTKGF